MKLDKTKLEHTQELQRPEDGRSGLFALHEGRTAAVIVAGGSSSRMGGVDKQFARLRGVPVLALSALSYERARSVDEIVIVTRAGMENAVEELCRAHGVTKLKCAVAGGETRQASVLCGLSAVSGDITLAAVHDGARPLVETAHIEGVIHAARQYGAAVLAAPARDTVKLADDGFVASTPDRERVFLAQTPQAFYLPWYLEAVKVGGAASFTDDSALLENAGFPVKIVPGDSRNIKLTTPEDFLIAEALFTEKESREAMNRKIRIGHGYDVHRLAPGRRLVLCGVEIPFEAGLMGHSDADVAAHAVSDALLGAAALGDIGGHFPDSAGEFKDADSMELLQRVVMLVHREGFSVNNLDLTIVAEKPKLAPFIPEMRQRLAAACGVDLADISIKATTEEGLGLAGEGIAAHCVCLIGV